MKNTLAQYGRSILAIIFLSVILSGPICAVVGVLIPFVGIKLVGLIATTLHFA
ncbi:MAG: hypothetical protein ABR955_09685 [Verrucomicrobiota bacterium]